MATEEMALMFGHWEKMTELQIKFVESLGKYKLDVAKAELVKAVTAQEWAVAKMKAEIAKQLELSLKRLNTAHVQAKNRKLQIAAASANAVLILQGDELDADKVPLVFQGFQFFEKLSPQDVLGEIMDTSIEPVARKGKSYVYNRDPSRTCEDVPEDKDNLRMLIAWLKQKLYMPKVGNRAYRQVTGAFKKIAAVGETEINKMTEAMKSMEENTYKTWNPIAIAALPSNVDVKKIVNAGVS
jgi:hypothetical protein